MSEGFNVGAVPDQRRADQRVGGALGSVTALELQQDVAGGRENDDIVINGILRNVLMQTLLKRSRRYSVLVGGIASKASNRVVFGEKTDVGRALIQVSHEDIDGNLRASLRSQQRFFLRLRSQVGDEVDSEQLERLARAAEVRAVAVQVRKQSKAIPSALQRGEAFPIPHDRGHISGELLARHLTNTEGTMSPQTSDGITFNRIPSPATARLRTTRLADHPPTRLPMCVKRGARIFRAAAGPKIETQITFYKCETHPL